MLFSKDFARCGRYLPLLFFVLCVSPNRVAFIQVDLEHNQYRSYQGLTCLMQISTRTEDFVVDTLKLRIYIGPHLRELFKDPSKKKVNLRCVFEFCMHSCYHLWEISIFDKYQHTISLGHAWSRSRYYVAAKGFWHIRMQYV